jgi:carboxyl-terminal processing protease
MTKYRFKKATIFLLLFIMLTNSAFSDKRDGYEKDYFEITKNLKILASIYERVNNYYVDEPLPGDLMKKGIDAMLASLDPYTVYIPESNIEDFRLITTGQYGGIGASIIKQGDYIVISELYENSPAQLSGLITGDTILAVDGASVTGNTIEQISRSLKGSADSKLKIQTTRHSIKKETTVIRKKIKIPAVPFSGIIEGDIGYVKLTSFTDKASLEVGKAIEEIKKENNISKLIIDLRGNGGGLLMQAVDIVNFFIPKDQLVVQTKGRMEEINRAYKTRNNPIDLEIQLVVLIDAYSASASEIVSGSLQDLDRAVIIGENSFGKGLVQQTKDLKFGSKIKLTVAKYYTPSGRCIQKLDYANKSIAGTADIIADSLIKVFHTKNGRKVKDSRGVDPDVLIEQEYFAKLSEVLIYNDYIFNYVNQYLREERNVISPLEYSFSDSDYKEFSNYLSNKKVEYTNQSEETLNQLISTSKKEKYYLSNETAFKKLKEQLKPNIAADLARHKKEIKKIIENEIISRFFFQKGRVEASLKEDPYIIQAKNILSDSLKYNNILNK